MNKYNKWKSNFIELENTNMKSIKKNMKKL